MSCSNRTNCPTSEQRGVHTMEVLVLDAQRTLLEQRIAFVRRHGPGLKRSASLGGAGEKRAKRARHAVSTSDPVESLFGKCRVLLTSLKKNQSSGPFLSPVDPVLQQCADYFDVVKKPMDMKTVGSKLKQGARVYSSPLEFRDDMRQIFSSCRLYNPSTHPLYDFANKMQEEFERRWKRSGIELQWHDLCNALEAPNNGLPPSAVMASGGKVHEYPSQLPTSFDCNEINELPTNPSQAAGVNSAKHPGSQGNLHSSQDIQSLSLANMVDLEKELIELTDRGFAPVSNVDETAPMPFVQRRQLSRRLDNLPEHMLVEVDQIFAESEPACEEMDLDTLDNKTLWRLKQLADTSTNDFQAPAKKDLSINE